MLGAGGSGHGAQADGFRGRAKRPKEFNGEGRGAQNPRTRPAVLRRRPARLSEPQEQAGPGAAPGGTSGRAKGERGEGRGRGGHAHRGQKHNANAHTPSRETTRSRRGTRGRGWGSPRGGKRVAAEGRERVRLGGSGSGGDRCGCGRVGRVGHGGRCRLVDVLLVSDVVVGCEVSDDVVSVGSLEG
jgi:hypothetical protein